MSALYRDARGSPRRSGTLGARLWRHGRGGPAPPTVPEKPRRGGGDRHPGMFPHDPEAAAESPHMCTESRFGQVSAACLCVGRDNDAGGKNLTAPARAGTFDFHTDMAMRGHGRGVRVCCHPTGPIRLARMRLSIRLRRTERRQSPPPYPLSRGRAAISEAPYCGASEIRPASASYAIRRVRLRPASCPASDRHCWGPCLPRSTCSKRDRTTSYSASSAAVCSACPAIAVSFRSRRIRAR